jgi:hypothetical protein
MIIKYNHRAINLNKVTEFYICEVTTSKSVEMGIKFDFDGADYSFFPFDDEEKANKAFDRILEDYRWQRMQCTLD